MNKSKTIKHYSIFAILVVFTILIRLFNLDNPFGLWHDEATIYSIANALPNVHINLQRFFIFPIYYIFYKIWITIFSNTDFVIRLMSVFFDTLNVITAYFLGRQITKNLKIEELKYKMGLITMFMFAINSSFIYYAQEAKFYSLTFFLVTLTTLTFLKFVDKFDKKSTILFVTSNALLLYTQTTLAVINILFTIIAIIFLYRIKKLNLFFISTNLAIYLPLICFIIFIKNYFSGNFDIVYYDNSFILQVLQNWFSPILTALQNNIPNYQNVVFTSLLNIKILLYVIFPIIFMISTFVSAIKNNKLLRAISIIPIAFVAFHILLSQTEFYSANVRYTLAVLPIVLSISAVYIGENFNKKFVKILFTLFVAVNLLVLCSPMSATKIERPIGYKALGELLVQNKINPNYNFVMPFNKNLLEKYYKITGETESFYNLNSTDAQKTYLSEKEIENISKKHDMKENYERYFITNEITKEFSEYVLKNYAKDANHLVLVIDRGICAFSNDEIKEIMDSNKNIPIQFLRLSKLNNDLITVLLTKYNIEKQIVDKNWEIILLKK